MVNIDDNVKVPRADSARGIHVQEAINQYKRLSKMVYGKEPNVSYSAPWIRIEGYSSRVKLSRLRELIRQLERRAA